MGFFNKTGIGKKDLIVEEVYENPKKTKNPLRAGSFIRGGGLYEKDVTLPRALMTQLGMNEGGVIKVYSTGNLEGVDVTVLNAPEELVAGPNKADNVNFFITMSESVRNALRLGTPKERSTKKFSNNYGPVYIRRK